MNASVRVVCGNCLRSVERTGSEVELAEVCPHCGARLSSEPASSVESEGSGSTDLASLPTKRGETTDWVETWSRGTLGSVGRFQLRERLGDGGFGQVYLAYDPRLDRDVALKVLKQPNPTERMMERFFREARAVARLDHPHIAAVHDAGFQDGRCWVAYQYISGRPLSWYRGHHQIDAATAARMIRSLADAVDHAHRMGVVHRDLKPANVIIDDQGQPRLIDFGLARRSDIESELTREGAVVGTPNYMSPEQALGRSRQVDERADVYSLGVIFHELLTGRRPDQPGSDSMLEESGQTPAAKLRELRARASKPPRELERICARALALDPAARHATARVFADEIDQWLKSHVRARRVKPGAWAGVAGVAFVILAFVPAILIPRLARKDTLAPQPLASGRAAVADQPARPISPAVEASPFVGNHQTKVFHRSECISARTMVEGHKVPFRSAAQAVDAGYRACDRCKPEDAS